MKTNKVIGIVITVLVLVLLASTIVSAGLTDWWARITGKATSLNQNISITVSGTQPVNISVINATLTSTIVDPTENAGSDITFYVTITDGDGTQDINTTRVIANFTLASGGIMRSNTSCSLVGNINSVSQNYSCTIALQYFDTPGTYNITVTATDLGNGTIRTNASTDFQYDSLQAMQISPTQLTWAALTPGQYNQTSNNDPTLINNTGNYNILNFSVTAQNLHGQTTTIEFIPAANFSVGNATGSNAECWTPSNPLINGSIVQINNTASPRGNHTANDGSTGQEQLYYCIRQVPSGITSQVYSTLNGGSWVITLI